MEDTSTVIPCEAGLTLIVTGLKGESRINREYPIVAFALTPGDDGQFSTVNRRLLPMILSYKLLPIPITELIEELHEEEIEEVKFVYMKNGVPAYKENVVKEPLKRRLY